MCISRLLTDGVIETPGGAHFTACVPDYNRDEAFQKAYVAAAGDPEAWAAFVQRYLEVDESGYQASVKEAAAEFAAARAAEKAATAGGATEKASSAGGSK
jgi:glutaconate CoA-transferase subunit A